MKFTTFRAWMLTPFLLLQGAPAKLAPANATVADEFLSVLSVRELADGRVLIADNRAGKVVVADLRAGTSRPVGRRGQGPGEYQVPGRSLALAGDSTLLTDNAGRRWIVTLGDAIVRTLSTTSDSSGALAAVWGAGSFGALSSDTLSNVLVRLSAVPRSNPNAAAVDDSLGFALVSRKTGKLTHVANVAKSPGSVVIQRNEARDPNVRGQTEAWRSGEYITLCSDGWIAVARQRPYRVDWRSPTGTWVKGNALPHDRVRVTEAEKRAYMLRAAAGRAPSAPNTITIWPDDVPALADADPICTPDAKIALRRAQHASQGDHLYDIVDRRGNLVRRLVMSSSERILGFGKSAAYVLFVDADAVQRVRRHAWP